MFVVSSFPALAQQPDKGEAFVLTVKVLETGETFTQTLEVDEAQVSVNRAKAYPLKTAQLQTVRNGLVELTMPDGLPLADRDLVIQLPIAIEKVAAMNAVTQTFVNFYTDYGLEDWGIKEMFVPCDILDEDCPDFVFWKPAYHSNLKQPHHWTWSVFPSMFTGLQQANVEDALIELTGLYEGLEDSQMSFSQVAADVTNPADITMSMVDIPFNGVLGIMWLSVDPIERKLIAADGYVDDIYLQVGASFAREDDASDGVSCLDGRHGHSEWTVWHEFSHAFGIHWNRGDQYGNQPEMAGTSILSYFSQCEFELKYLDQENAAFWYGDGPLPLVRPEWYPETAPLRLTGTTPMTATILPPAGWQVHNVELAFNRNLREESNIVVKPDGIEVGIPNGGNYRLVNASLISGTTIFTYTTEGVFFEVADGLVPQMACPMPSGSVQAASCLAPPDRELKLVSLVGTGLRFNTAITPMLSTTSTLFFPNDLTLRGKADGLSWPVGEHTLSFEVCDSSDNCRTESVIVGVVDYVQNCTDPQVRIWDGCVGEGETEFTLYPDLGYEFDEEPGPNHIGGEGGIRSVSSVKEQADGGLKVSIFGSFSPRWFHVQTWQERYNIEDNEQLRTAYFAVTPISQPGSGSTIYFPIIYK